MKVTEFALKTKSPFPVKNIFKVNGQVCILIAPKSSLSLSRFSYFVQKTNLIIVPFSYTFYLLLIIFCNMWYTGAIFGLLCPLMTVAELQKLLLVWPQREIYSSLHGMSGGLGTSPLWVNRVMGRFWE